MKTVWLLFVIFTQGDIGSYPIYPYEVSSEKECQTALIGAERDGWGNVKNANLYCMEAQTWKK